MSYALLEPSLLSICEEDWLCEAKRDDYLEHFSSIMSCINDSESIELAWNDLYDEFFWTSPQKRPWKRDVYWSNTIIPIIYEKLQKNAVNIEVDGDECQIKPKIKYDRDDFYSVFSQMLPKLHLGERDILVCLGLKNIPAKPHEFFVMGKKITPIPKLLYSPSCFLSLIDIENQLWPLNGGDNEKFLNAINIKLERDYIGKLILYDFSFTKNFLKKISKVQDSRDKIITSIARRLFMTTAEAGRDGCLQDEDIVGSTGVRRFRVTPRPSSKRIHYNKEGNSIEFSMFYDVGEHDDGL